MCTCVCACVYTYMHLFDPPNHPKQDRNSINIFKLMNNTGDKVIENINWTKMGKNKKGTIKKSEESQAIKL